MRLMSAAAGTFMAAEDFRGLLRKAVEESLCEQVRWDKICLAISSTLAKIEKLKSCVVMPVVSNAATILSSALQTKSHLHVTILNILNTKVEGTHTSQAPGKFQDSKIAIVGFSGRFPEAASNDELWQVLMAARDCSRTIPEDRFDWEAHYDPTGKKKNHTRVKYGCFINEPGVFDAKFFNLSPREADNTDPAQRLALMSAYEAIEMAGLVPDRTPSTQRDRIGVFFGVTSDDWREVNSGQDVDTYFIPGGNRAFVPGRISYFFRLSGPSISVDTACSSSFAAISTACKYLWQGDCDSAIAGGTNVLTNPDNFVGLDRGHFLSMTGNCAPFDNSASGYCRADAVGAVILKRLEDAQADHDPIFGVIVGSSTNHCGQTISITRPHEGDQLSLFKRILRHTNTNPTDVSYVEMHGTGTQAGDAAEMRSVLSAFAWDRQRTIASPPRPLYLGAVKANVGHAESASGVTSLIKVLMMMRHSEVPPHRLNGELNRNYPTDMTDRNVHIAFKPTPWRREDCPGGKRMAFLNNFSAAGGNTAILLEDAPPRATSVPLRPADARTIFPVAVSAKTATAVEANCRALIAYLERNSQVSLPALSYTTTARRTHYKFRLLVSGANTAAVRAALQRLVDEKEVAVKCRSTAPKVAFIFTGQGTLYTGIGKQLFKHVSSFRADIIRFNRIAQCQGHPNFLPLISGNGGADENVVDPIVAQLTVVCVQMALSHLWTLWVGEPSSVIGHSLGEYAALYAVGVLSACDTIHLVGNRARLLEKYCTKRTHLMLAVKAPAVAIATSLAKTTCTVACINSPTSTVVSGPMAEIQQLAEWLKSGNVDAITLNVPYAFHSPQVEPILAEYETLASTIHFNEPKVPYMSPLLSKTVVAGKSGILNASYLARATRECVDFKGAIEAALDTKVVNDSTLWIEIGAHPACSGMVKQIMGSHILTAPSLRKDANTWKVLVDSLEALYLAGADINWNEFHRDFEAAHEVLSLPSYKWDLKNYWIQYRHNFCLTKGDDPARLSPQVSATLSDNALTAQSLSSSVHRLLEENNSDEVSVLLTESDLHDPRLVPIFSGHKVNTAMLCPSSLYADIALTIANHMLKSNGKLNDKVGLDCGTMNVQRPLISQPGATSQLFRVSAIAKWPNNEISLKFFSVDTAGCKLADHASCVMRITKSQNWLDDWKRNAYLITSRISSLHQATETGSAHKLKRGLVYKLFSALVDYAPNYQGMQQVILDSEYLEATAVVKFQVGDQGFHWNPCWIDSLGHIAGFIMNGNENIASKDQVFINHGWESMRCAKPIDGEREYVTYNRMQLETGTMYIGNTYIFEGQELVAIFEGIRFQGVNRTVLDKLLPGKVGVAAKHPAPEASLDVQANNSTKVDQVGKVTTPAPPQSQPEKAVGALKIIIDEVQISEDQVDMDAEFADLGIDSLLALTIVSRLREELEIDIPSSAFMADSTIRAFLSSLRGEACLEPSSTQTAASTLSSSSSSQVEDEYETDATPPIEDNCDSDADIMATVRKVIAEETGTNIEDISPNSALSVLGLDDLLAPTIMRKISEDINVKLPSRIFTDCETLRDVEAALRKAGIINKTSPKIAGENKTPFVLDAPPHATSALLQGSPRVANKTLFFFPDGAGSATSYMNIPEISQDVVVYGLNCPWLRTPENLKLSFEDYVAKFLVEIRRRQPHGPYNFGGSSAGGILAYEAAQQLECVGEKIDRLILLDTPDPVGLENPNQRMYDFLDSMGMFGMMGKQTPSWLRPHFDAFLAVLDGYKVKKYTGRSPPPTHIIYARDGMCKYPTDPRPEIRPDDPREMLWLLNNRTDFSGAGWNTLLGKQNLHVSVLDDVNHYTILQSGPKIKELSCLLAHALRE